MRITRTEALAAARVLYWKASEYRHEAWKLRPEDCPMWEEMKEQGLADAARVTAVADALSAGGTIQIV